MYIQTVALKNIKGFEDLEFNFGRHPPLGEKAPHKTIFAGWNVITGENGSGKTALLKAMAIGLVGPDIARALQPSFRGWVREGETKGEIALAIRPQDEDRFKGGRRPEGSIWSELDLGLDSSHEVALRPGNARRGKQKGPINGPWTEHPTGWFSAGYGPFRRLYGASPEAMRLMTGPRCVARFATLFKEDATLSEGVLWLRDLAHKRLEGKDRETRILEQVLALVNDDFLRNGLRIDEINSDGLWMKDAAGTRLPLSDMSEGYRAAIAMMMDIVRHLSEAHGEGDLVRRLEDRLVVPHTGVVLIDEIDAHLHPEWQRLIGFWLKERFPAIQFIVTTHSALVCQAADEGGIFTLPPPGSGQAPFQLSHEDWLTVVRSKPDEILLTPAFGMSHSRSPLVVKAGRDYANLEARRRVRELSDEEKARQQALFPFLAADSQGS